MAHFTTLTVLLIAVYKKIGLKIDETKVKTSQKNVCLQEKQFFED